jgi:hypothetical protein
MSLCASCGLELPGDGGLCPHHHCVYGEDWAEGNKIFCDWLHRRIEPPKVSESDIPLGEEDQTPMFVVDVAWWARYVRWQDWNAQQA